MENGPLIFLAIAAAIALLALLVGRLFGHKINKPMPGDDPRNHETHWYGGDGSN